MSTEDLQKRTTVNIQEKANLIWAIADKLVGTYKPHEYGNVILPMCVIKRFSDTLAPTKDAVLKANDICEQRGLAVRKGFLTTASGYDFYNVSPFTFEGLLSDADNIADNFRSYLNHFSENVVDIIEKFDFDKEITKLDHNGILYNVIQEFCSKKAYMGADEISAVDMGYIFEELVRKFSESYDEQAGAHFTARDIIYLMAELLVAPQQTFAIAKANVLIKGGDAENMRHGNTLSDDKFEGYTFDYIISNPPFGIEWKNEKAKVEEEHKRGDMGRFAPGLPAIGDSQQLFMLNGIAKLKETGRMAIIQNGSPLFKGDAGSGESNIRGYLLDNDWLEAIVQIPNDMFYNTGIATYIWIVTKDKSPERAGKVQLIDASKCCEKRRKSLGNKRNEFTDRCIDLIAKAYMAFTDGTYEDGELVVESKVKDNDDFKFTKVAIKLPEKKKDTENVPFKEDIEAYMQKNVYPYAPEAKVDVKASKIGYEIPFTREFYKYVAPRKSEEIFAHLQELEQQESVLMAKIMGR